MREEERTKDRLTRVKKPACLQTDRHRGAVKVRYMEGKQNKTTTTTTKKLRQKVDEETQVNLSSKS